MNDISHQAQYEDMQSLLFGRLLGVGTHRKVCVFLPDTSLVIKCATESPHRNIIEGEVWCMVEDTNIGKWFAPCAGISACGMFLLQKRAEMRPRNEYPKEMPSFFGDTKYSNFGWIDGRFVCVDYTSYFSTSMSHRWSGRMKKAHWWGE